MDKQTKKEILKLYLPTMADVIESQSTEMYTGIMHAMDAMEGIVTCNVSCEFIDWVFSDACLYLSYGPGQWHHVLNKNDVVSTSQLYQLFQKKSNEGRN